MYPCIVIIIIVIIIVIIDIIIMGDGATLAWGFDYNFTNSNLKQALEFQKGNLDFHPSGNI